MGWGGAEEEVLCMSCVVDALMAVHHWGVSKASLCIIFKSASLADLFSIKQYLVTLKKSVLKKHY